MIKILIFDFGDVFINLDKEAPYNEMEKLGIRFFSEEMIQTNILYEKGLISTEVYFDYYITEHTLGTNKYGIHIWNINPNRRHCN